MNGIFRIPLPQREGLGKGDNGIYNTFYRIKKSNKERSSPERLAKVVYQNIRLTLLGNEDTS